MESYTQNDCGAAAMLMDDEIREDMHDNFEPGFDNPDAFLREYIRRHAEKFGEEFRWA